MDLSKRDPGPISHARWLTCANRVLRLYYVRVESSSDALKDLVTFILKSYMPVWFEIKCSKYNRNGPRPICTEHLTHVDTCRNAFCAHPENLLLSTICDERKHIRELGFRRVLKARQTVQKEKCTELYHSNLKFSSSRVHRTHWLECGKINISTSASKYI